MDFKNAIFDMDGTLIDSMYFWRDVLVDCVEQVHNVKFTKDERNALIYVPFHTLAEFSKETKDIDIKVKEVLEMCYERMLKIYLSGEIKIKPFVPEFLSQIKSKGAKIALATATKKDVCIPYLKFCGLYQYFDCIYTSFDDAKISKEKSSKIYDMALADINGTKEDTVIFEDTIDCIKTAKNNGYLVFAVSDICQGNTVDEIKRISDKFINTYKELME